MSARDAWAQAAPHRVFIADVFASADSTPVEGAEVIIPGLSRAAHTDFSGETIIPGLPEGSFRVVVRKIGFVAADVTIQFARDTVRFNFLLGAGTTPLDTVRTIAERVHEQRLRDFDIRQRMGIGRFLTDSMLLAHPNTPVADLIADRFPGLAVVDNGRSVARRLCVGPTGGAIPNGRLRLYIDGVRTSSRGAPDETDLNLFMGRDVAGVEYYTTENAPVQFREQGFSCGVLLIWLRR